MTNIKPVSLTQNGNPYKKSTTATKVITALGTVPWAAVTAGSAFSKNNKGQIKVDAGILASGAIMIAISAVIGKLIGSIIDGQTNKIRMAQADGEAALAVKNVNVSA